MSLVRSLNQLLNALGLPFVIETPTDLTPSLLLAILASILCEPIHAIHGPDEASFDDTIVALTDLSQSHDTLPAFKVKQMKVLLGVLNEVLPVDVCLSDVDPRRLAKGEWEEVKFVGELFVWLGKKLGRITGEASDDEAVSCEDAHAGRGLKNGSPGRRRGGTTRQTRRPPSPTYTTSTNNSFNPTNLSMRSFTSSRIEIETMTSPPSTSGSVRTAVPDHQGDVLGDLESPSANTSTSHRPWCIHELKVEPTDIIPVYSPTGTSFCRPASPSSENRFQEAGASSWDPPIALPDVFSAKLTTCHCSSSMYPHPRPATQVRGLSRVDRRTPDASPRRHEVRHEGYISYADEDSELSWFEASRHFRLQSIDFGGLPQTPRRRPQVDEDRLPMTQRSTPNVAQRIKLMEERAVLLAQLALAQARAGAGAGV
ncbi:hypothetical protein PLEOSDRAFT_1099897 [Pleurotus ostreatus PC15]|uniref:DUF5745 domain-containing protein n=1 Tax=Pleurotus ostreatus (strain PC15) TaxID=1137138 RepID=A0A067P0U9_PLEO1|nr:hypothetical protein PLEOSDRAFT_1099897 [Pleurotus ostreatus PC15]